jgi:AcrR family transcriptional regulator
MSSREPDGHPVEADTHRGPTPPGSTVAKDRPLRRDAEENRRRVLEAATEVFDAHGLDASVEDIAHSAGVGMGTLYRRFPNKEALIDQLVRDMFERMLAAGREALEVADGTGLGTFLQETASLYQSHRGCISRMWSGPLPEALFVEFDRILAELVDRAQGAGVIRADCALTDILVLFWAIRGIVESTGDAAPEAWKRHVDIVLAGLRPGAAPLPHVPLSGEQRQMIIRARARAGARPQ